MKEKELITTAIKASKNAFNPRRGSHGVGAAVLTKSGKIFPGTNVQSVISGLGTCAERCAIYNAVANGHDNIVALAVFFPSKKFTDPCGACLQVMSEFSEVSGKDIKIIEINQGKKTREKSTRQLLHHPLGPVELKWKVKKFRRRA